MTTIVENSAHRTIYNFLTTRYLTFRQHQKLMTKCLL